MKVEASRRGRLDSSYPSDSSSKIYLKILIRNIKCKLLKCETSEQSYIHMFFPLTTLSSPPLSFHSRPVATMVNEKFLFFNVLDTSLIIFCTLVYLCNFYLLGLQAENAFVTAT